MIINGSKSEESNAFSSPCSTKTVIAKACPLFLAPITTHKTCKCLFFKILLIIDFNVMQSTKYKQFYLNEYA